MKCLLLADNRPELLATLEPILKHWGYRVLSARNAEQVSSFLSGSTPCLLIIGQPLFTEQSLVLGKDISALITASKLPMIVLGQESDVALPIEPSEYLDVPVDIFALFSFIQRHVEKHPRHNLRLRVRLPGMYRSEGEEFILADVLSLSMKGLFFKSHTRLHQGDRLSVVFPLFGHCKELEVDSEVLYIISPDTSNNYMQGFGVGFNPLTEDQQQSLQKFIEEHFLKEVSACNVGVGEFSEQQIKR